MKKKIVERIERVFKGAANHNRVEILDYIATANDTTLWQISQELEIDFRLVSHHTEILESAGLIEKQYVGRSVMHFLTPYGKAVVDFFKILS
ncbi:MAG: winged helix-turn-helix domain-containing protein [Candidatus Berkelbacteria bacterium]